MGTRTRQDSALTLVEVLVVIVIIAILAGLILSATGPARERARQTTCLSNLRQIGIALGMYRSEYGGAEISGGKQAAYELGLPYDPLALMSHLKCKEVLHCPDEDFAYLGIAPGKAVSSYMWTPRPDDEGGPSFSNAVAKRGERTPIAVCEHHDPARHLTGPESTVGFGTLLVLRLGGEAERVQAPRKVGSSFDY
jgi:prepilin-type N-terminal cleavage/methylation domain-containing protein